MADSVRWLHLMRAPCRVPHAACGMSRLLAFILWKMHKNAAHANCRCIPLRHGQHLHLSIKQQQQQQRAYSMTSSCHRLPPVSELRLHVITTSSAPSRHTPPPPTPYHLLGQQQLLKCFGHVVSFALCCCHFGCGTWHVASCMPDRLHYLQTCNSIHTHTHTRPRAPILPYNLQPAVIS